MNGCTCAADVAALREQVAELERRLSEVLWVVSGRWISDVNREEAERAEADERRRATLRAL